MANKMTSVTLTFRVDGVKGPIAITAFEAGGISIDQPTVTDFVAVRPRGIGMLGVALLDKFEISNHDAQVMCSEVEQIRSAHGHGRA